jgi:hypothetical protein
MQVFRLYGRPATFLCCPDCGGEIRRLRWTPDIRGDDRAPRSRIVL